MHYYDLPMWTLGGVSDSKLPDQQAAAEAALTLMTDALSGGHMIHDIGYLDSAYTGSLSQLVLCNDIVGWVKQLMTPVEIDDESLALDVIDEVGPGGVFLKHKHTRRHARDRFQPRVFERESYDDWLAHGGLDATARAAARVDEILASHEPAAAAGGRAARAARRGRGGREPAAGRVRAGARVMSGTPLGPQPLAPLRADSRMRSPPQERLDELVQAALEVLQRTGVRVRSPAVVRVVANHGAYVAPDGQTVRFAPELVRAALRSAPRTFVLASRDGSCDLDLSLPQTHCTVDGCAVDIIEPATGRRRTATKVDLAAITRVVDYLGSLGFWWPAVSANDCGATSQLHELDAGWNNTRKHLQGMVQGERLARYAVAMADAVAGGREGLRRRPVLSDLICTVSPLVDDRRFYRRRPHHYFRNHPGNRATFDKLAARQTLGHLY